MAENEQEQGPRPRLTNCPFCGHATTVIDPRGVVVNAPTFSQVLAIHERVPKCENCGEVLMPIVRQAQLFWDYVKVPQQPDRPRLVTPPAGLKI